MNKKISTILSLGIIIFLAVFLIIVVFQTNKKINISWPSISSPTVKLNSDRIYENFYISFIKRNNFLISNNIYIDDWIMNNMEIPKSNIFKIIYDTSQGSSYSEGRFDIGYYVFLKGIKISDKKYQGNNLSANVSTINTGLLPYLNDPSYCQTDSDCIIRTNFCSYGAYNKFAEHAIFGCEGITYPQENQAELSTLCKPKLEFARISYSGSKCLDNKCIPIGRSFRCEAFNAP